MSNVFTLDALREETIRRYAPTIVDLGDGVTVELRNILRLSEKDRNAVVAAIESINDVKESDDESEEEADDDEIDKWADLVIEACTKVFRLIAVPSSKKLVAALDHEDKQIKATLFTSVLTRWIGESQLGEAASSLS